MSDLAARLAMLAARGETETYGEMARGLGLRIGTLTAALEDLMASDAAAGQPLRAALCKGRLSDGMPARGFFDKAAELGFDVSDPAGFVAQQRAGLFSRQA
jgi:hypothetical protein